MVSSGRTHINISATRNLIALEAGSSLCKHELSESRSKAAGSQVITKWRRAHETPYSGRPLKKMMNVRKKTRTRRSVGKVMMITKKENMTMTRIKTKPFKLKEKGE
jgi:hypothetical protein